MGDGAAKLPLRARHQKNPFALECALQITWPSCRQPADVALFAQRPRRDGYILQMALVYQRAAAYGCGG